MTSFSNQELQDLLNEQCTKHNVVGASLAVYSADEVQKVASGVLNLKTGVEATPESLFQIGSISKVFTTTLIMQLVEEGVVKLDGLVKSYLPSFRLADMTAANTITVRQLLCHISGMDGDYFPEDDPFCPTVASFVERCALLPQLHPTGQYLSYSNSAFTVAGRIIETVTRLPWYKAIEQRILGPLGMDESVANPVDMLKFRGAMGHLPDENPPHAPSVAADCYLPLSHAPAGSVLSMSASDLVKFARMHLNGGEGNNRRILSEQSTKMMTEEQFTLPPYPRGITHWGLGWYLNYRHNRHTFGHTGGTIGQYAYLCVCPEQGCIVALLTNSASASMYLELEAILLEKLAGYAQEPEPRIKHLEVDCDRLVGTYANINSKVSVYQSAGKLVCKLPPQPFGSSILELNPIEEDVFVVYADNQPSRGIHFLGADEHGRAQYLFTGGRLLKRNYPYSNTGYIS